MYSLLIRYSILTECPVLYPTRTLDTSPEMQGSKSLLMLRQFFRAGRAPARASTVLTLRIGRIWVYQMDIRKGNPTKVHLDEKPESILRKNSFSEMKTKVHEFEPLSQRKG